MKRIILSIGFLLWASPVWACDHLIRAYATATTVDFCLYKLDASGLKADAASAAGDIKLAKNEGAEASLTTDSFVDEGQCYSLALSATETTAARLYLAIVDQSGPQVWLDKCIIIETYGHASAQFPDQSASLLATTVSELSAMPSASAPTVGEMLRFVFQYGVGLYKKTCTSSACTLLKDDGSTTLGTCSKSDNGTTYTASECS